MVMHHLQEIDVAELTSLETVLVFVLYNTPFISREDIPYTIAEHGKAWLLSTMNPNRDGMVYIIIPKRKS